MPQFSDRSRLDLIRGPVTLRAVVDADTGFLFQLYCDVRSREVASFGWPGDDARSFLKMQFEMRRAAYEMRYPQADFQIIQFEGLEIGEMVIDKKAGMILLVDISIASKFRGRGIGATVMRMLQEDAADTEMEIMLHVDRTNVAAQRLYTRLGFVDTESGDQISIEMRWRPL